MSETPKSAAEAFDALREEVGKLRNGIEQIYRQGQEIKTAATPRDYNLTLGKMEQRLGAIEAGLQHVNAVMPPIELPGEHYTPRELDKLTEEAKAAAGALGKATRYAIKQQTMRWWVAGAFGLGTVIGIILFIGIANLLPKLAGTWMAGAIFGGDPWSAGATLMRQADPVSFERMVELYQACPPNVPVELCRATIAIKPGTTGQ